MLGVQVSQTPKCMHAWAAMERVLRRVKALIDADMVSDLMLFHGVTNWKRRSLGIVDRVADQRPYLGYSALSIHRYAARY